MGNQSITLRALINRLTEMEMEAGPEAQVHMAVNPSWSFEHHVGKVDLVTEPDEEGYMESTVYIGDGGQIDYLPSKARWALGWE
ncbi:hypothetical protein ACWFMI_23755 [Nocardiopsis terrae]|uniref:hypothetical protein n=1 Tax=Streptomyces sp. NPDC057554 TaxID=3350538 RepID=UPI0036B82F2E